MFSCFGGKVFGDEGMHRCIPGLNIRTPNTRFFPKTDDRIFLFVFPSSRDMYSMVKKTLQQDSGGTVSVAWWAAVAGVIFLEISGLFGVRMFGVSSGVGGAQGCCA